MEPITIGIMIALALASMATQLAGAGAQSAAYKAQAANVQRNQASVVDQYRRSVTEASQRKAQEDAKFAEQRDAEQRNKLQALGILENRAGASGQIGNSVDAALGDLYASIARQENIGSYNEKILQQNAAGEFKGLADSFTSAYNQASPYLQKPSALGQALEIGTGTLQGAASGYQLGSSMKTAKTAGDATRENTRYLRSQLGVM
jgi:hypothetical protein